MATIMVHTQGCRLEFQSTGAIYENYQDFIGARQLF